MIRFEIDVPRIKLSIVAKNKKQALKEARKAIDFLLKREEYWIEKNI
jgi:hypothetical protein